MGFQREFAEILKEKMGISQGIETQKPHTPMNFSYEERNESFISAPQFSWAPSKIPSQYPKSEAPKQEPKPKVQVNFPKPKVEIKEPSYKIGELGLEMATPFMTLIRLGAHLDEDAISLTTLKKEYRKLAKLYHPDHCDREDAGKIFQTCCQSYGQLKRALNQMSNK